MYSFIKHNIEYNILNVHHDYIFNTLYAMKRYQS